jgi:hypothetical protein
VGAPRIADHLQGSQPDPVGERVEVFGVGERELQFGRVQGYDTTA